MVPLSDASRPAVLEVDTFGTAINVSASDGKEVVIVARETTAKEAERDDGRRGPGPRAARARGKPDDGDEASTAGLHRIPNTSIGLTATEENNLVTVKTDFTRQPLALDISVPRNTSVRLKTVNGGDMTVTGVRGEHELSNVNGRIFANDIAGSLVASSTNGTIRATFTDVTAAKPMSFNTFNGDVDVTFPAKLAATLRVTSGHGELLHRLRRDGAAATARRDAGRPERPLRGAARARDRGGRGQGRAGHSVQDVQRQRDGA